ncbi:MAG: peptidase M48, partial [Luminiphilus sp.]|nr:peptidase M48 [Luminiphilus sp.]
MKNITSLVLFLIVSGFGSSRLDAASVSVGCQTIVMPEAKGDEHQRLLNTIGAYDDPEVSAYINTIG